MRQDRFKRNGGVYKCQTFGTLQHKLMGEFIISDDLIVIEKEWMDYRLYMLLRAEISLHTRAP